MARTARIDGGAQAITRRRVQIGHRLDAGKRRADRGAYRGLLDAPADERRRDGVEPQRNGGDRADADGGTAADAVLVEGHLGGRGREREVAAAGVDLVEGAADARLAPDRKPHRGEAGRRRQRRHHRSDEEIGGRDLAALGAVPIAQQTRRA